MGGGVCPNGKCSARGVARRQRESVHQAAQALVFFFFFFFFFLGRRRVVCWHSTICSWVGRQGGPGLGLEGGPGLGSRGPRLGLELGAPRLGSGGPPLGLRAPGLGLDQKKKFRRLRRKFFFGALMQNFVDVAKFNVFCVSKISGFCKTTKR